MRDKNEPVDTASAREFATAQWWCKNEYECVGCPYDDHHGNVYNSRCSIIDADGISDLINVMADEIDRLRAERTSRSVLQNQQLW